MVYFLVLALVVGFAIGYYFGNRERKVRAFWFNRIQ